MMTVNEVSKISGVSIRALHHYDRIGLLPATEVTKAGYRMYDDMALERLQQILIYRELEFSLKDIKEILNSPGFYRTKALEQQINLLELRMEHIQNLIVLANGIKLTGMRSMNFETFDTRKIDEYARQAKESWGSTPEYNEFEEKNRHRTLEEMQLMGNRFVAIIAEFGKMKDMPEGAPVVQAQVKKLRDYITANYYRLSDEILARLGTMYAGGGTMTANIDVAGGAGTADFMNRAIQAMVSAAK